MVICFPVAAGDNEIYIPEEEIANEPYLELLQEAAAENGEEPIFQSESPYNGYDDIKLISYGGQLGYFVPESIEEDILSGYPRGNKRDSNFFPFAREPETHYGAFVPEKRSYEETYEKLLTLARALGEQREEPLKRVGYISIFFL